MPTIPKKLHAIWLGSPLSKEGRDNIDNWMKANPDYEMNLWIDSSLFPDLSIAPKSQQEAMERNQFIEEYEAFKQWVETRTKPRSDAKHESISEEPFRLRIRDLAGRDKKFYQGMLNRVFFDDEISGAHRNLSAASDILRTAIMDHLQEGGVYFDVKDIFPGIVPLGNLSSQFGLLCHPYEDMNGGIQHVSSDILASEPHGFLISHICQSMQQQYKKLYSDPKLLQAHRSASFSQRDFYDAADSRFRSTLETSANTLFMNVFMSLTGQFIPGHQDQGKFDLSKVLMAKDKFKAPFYAGSWIEKASKVDISLNLLRNYLRVYFEKKIDAMCADLTASQNNKLFKAADVVKRKDSLLRIKNALNAFPIHWEMTQVYAEIIKLITPEEQQLLLQGKITICDELSKASHSLEKDIFPQLKQCGPELFTQMVDGIKFLGNDFIEEILLAPNPHAEFIKLLPKPNNAPDVKSG